MTSRFSVLMTGLMLFLPVSVAVSDETIGCPRDIGRGKLKPRVIFADIRAVRCYSDLVWEALRDSSPYSRDHNQMVELPEGWYHNETKLGLGLEFGAIDRVNLGVFTIYDVARETRHQVWSESENRAVWEETRGHGPEDVWFSVRGLVLRRPPNWQNGLLLNAAYKPPITTDDQVRQGIGSGTHDFKVAVSTHPHLTKNIFGTAELCYHNRGQVKDIDRFDESGRDLGDRLRYWAFVGSEFFGSRFAAIAGMQGDMTASDRDRQGDILEDSDRFTHNLVLKLRWQPFGSEDGGSIMLLGQIPLAYKTDYKYGPASFVPIIWGTVAFPLFR